MLESTLEKIEDLYQPAMESAQKRLNSLSKPIGSMGRLEDLLIQLAGIYRTPFPDISQKAIVIMCADNGIVEEGVSSCPKSVTLSVTENFTKGITCINVFSKKSDVKLHIVDIGIDGDVGVPGVDVRKIARGTRNFLKEPAMTRSEAIAAIETGIRVVNGLYNQGYNFFGTGEMGIGNTTTSSAIAAIFTGESAETVTGRGSGLSDQDYLKKIRIVNAALNLYNFSENDPLDVLEKVGGFDIAGLAGCFIGCAALGVPCVIDGFISSVAALTAVKISGKVKNFLIASHGSAEPGNNIVMKALGLKPYLDLDMRLGEGTGAALMMNIIDYAYKSYSDMGTFDDAGILQYKIQNKER